MKIDNSQILASNTFQAWKASAHIPTIWDDSKFEQFRQFHSSRKGAQGEQFVADILESMGYAVHRSKKGKACRPAGGSSDYDLLVNDLRVEVKASTAWDENPNNFKWQQIRNQQYDRIVFMGVNPNEAWMWWASKLDLEAHIFGRDEYRQHAGKDGNQELYWIASNDNIPVPAWFRTINTFA